MPHVTVKLWPGRTEEQKADMADRIVNALVTALQIKPDSVSVGVEEVKPEDWQENVYRPEIEEKRATLYKKPGY